ncbi:MAG: mitochondrial fission ELM1 family protein [Magnetococcales bacterium]|nr:mitochondrial fission ELM1 family protein [Magnetococcales bacterium]
MSEFDQKQSVVIWRYLDGRRGHETQTLGLVEALSVHLSITCYDIPIPSKARALKQWLFGGVPSEGRMPPDLIIAAGHGTHIPLLATRRWVGGRTVLIMKPSLPRRWFDLCIIPAHDQPSPADNIIVTEGGLNRVQPVTDQHLDKGLFLIGGPSKHHGWDQNSLIKSIEAIIEKQSSLCWTLTTSPRTPDDFVSGLASLSSKRVTVVPFEQTRPDWLPAQLAQSAWSWVSEDSVNMVYESLTSGCGVGVLPMPRNKKSRLVDGLDQLAEKGSITTFAQWQQGQALEPLSAPLCETRRCAREIVRRWYPSQN